MSQFVQYECKPVLCGDCKGIGHTTEDCRRKKYELALAKIKPRQVWAPKAKPNTTLQKHVADVGKEKEVGDKEIMSKVVEDVDVSQANEAPVSVVHFQEAKQSCAGRSGGGKEQEMSTRAVMVGGMEVQVDTVEVAGEHMILLLMDNVGVWNISPMKHSEIRSFLTHYKIGLFGFLETRVKAVNFPKVFPKVCSSFLLSLTISTIEVVEYGWCGWLVVL